MKGIIDPKVYYIKRNDKIEESSIRSFFNFIAESPYYNSPIKDFKSYTKIKYMLVNIPIYGCTNLYQLVNYQEYAEYTQSYFKNSGKSNNIYMYYGIQGKDEPFNGENIKFYSLNNKCGVLDPFTVLAINSLNGLLDGLDTLYDFNKIDYLTLLEFCKDCANEESRKKSIISPGSIIYNNEKIIPTRLFHRIRDNIIVVNENSIATNDNIIYSNNLDDNLNTKKIKYVFVYIPEINMYAKLTKSEYLSLSKIKSLSIRYCKLDDNHTFNEPLYSFEYRMNDLNEILFCISVIPMEMHVNEDIQSNNKITNGWINIYNGLTFDLDLEYSHINITLSEKEVKDYFTEDKVYRISTGMMNDHKNEHIEYMIKPYVNFDIFSLLIQISKIKLNMF